MCCRVALFFVCVSCLIFNGFCGPIIRTGIGGVEKSAGFPLSNYQANISQRWHISLSDAQKVFQLKFLSFDIEGYANVPCTFDYVVLFDANHLNRLRPACSAQNLKFAHSGPFCNGHVQLRQDITVHSSVVLIDFCTDAFNEGGGFLFYWHSADPFTATSAVPTSTSPPTTPPVNCGYNVTISEGQSITIRSPGYPPGPYGPKLHCIWHVVGSAAFGTILVTANHFDTEGDRGPCTADRLNVMTDQGASYSFCGDNGPRLKLHFTQRLTFEMLTDSQIEQTGFEIVVFVQPPPATVPPVDAHCGETFQLTANSLVPIFSPLWPNAYPPDAFCNWTFRADYEGFVLTCVPAISVNRLHLTKAIQLNFVKFYTEFQFDVLTLAFSNGSTTTFTGLIGPMAAKVVVDSRIDLQFKADDFTSYPGFHIELSLVDRPFRCAAGSFKCANERQCIAARQHCDGAAQCDDGSDESDAQCSMGRVCGSQTVEPNVQLPDGRVVNGSHAKPGSWPWMVSLHDYASDFQFCGATLISPQWIVTAAHCLVDGQGQPNAILAKIGSYRQSEMDPPWEVDVQLERIFIHPKFTGIHGGSDVSVARLRRPVTFPFNNFTNVACLPPYRLIVHGGTHCVTMGYGITDGTGSNAVLNQVVVPTLTNAHCNDAAHYNGQISETMLCAGYEDGMKDTCQGDSGGPLVCRAADGKWVLQGIVSWGKGCAAPHRPGVYTRVSAIVNYIYDIIRQFDN